MKPSNDNTSGFVARTFHGCTRFLDLRSPTLPWVEFATQLGLRVVPRRRPSSFWALPAILFLFSISTLAQDSIWSLQGGGGGEDDTYAIGIDALGNVLVAGDFGASAQFGGSTTEHQAKKGFFIAKVASVGEAQWVRQTDGVGIVRAMDLTVHPDGSAVVVGHIQGEAIFGPIRVNPNNSPEISAFFARYSADGSVMWVKTITGDEIGVGWQSISAVAVTQTAAGDLLDVIQVTSPSGNRESWVEKRESNGGLLWRQRLDCPNMKATDLVAKPGYGIIVSGVFSSPIRFGSEALEPYVPDWDDIFVARLNDAGQMEWARRGGGVAPDPPPSLALDDQGRILISGVSNQSAVTFGETNQVIGAGLGFPTGYVAKYDGEGGLISVFGMHGVTPGDVAGASSGHYILTGSKVGVGWVTAKYDRNDNLIWFIESSVAGNSRGNKLAVDAEGAVSLTLWAEGMLPLGDRTYTSFGAGDCFLTRLSEDVAPVFVVQPAPSPFGLQLGSNVAFSPKVRSLHPVDFQWLNNGIDIPAATNVSIIITNCQLGDQGDYQLVARNRFGGTTSAVARLTIFFELRLRIQGSGRVDREPKFDGGFFGGTYPHREIVRLTAVPDLGTSFSRWSGDHTGPDNPTQIVLSTNLSITAHFSDSITNLVLDDEDAGVSVEGNWAVQHDRRGYSGGVYRVAGANAAPPVRVAYRPEVHLAGVYAVMAWMPSVVRAPQYGTALWDIPVTGGRSNAVVYQPRASGAWLKVADDVFFDGGTNDFLILSPGGDAPGLVVADAIRLVGQSIAPVVVALPQVRAEGLWFGVEISTGAHVDLESTTNLKDWNHVRERVQFRDSGVLVPWAELHDGHRFFRVQIRP